MNTDHESTAEIDYNEKGKAHDDTSSVRPNKPGPARRPGPTVRIEFVAVEGPEGEQLHALQAAAVRHVLTVLANQRRAATPKED